MRSTCRRLFNHHFSITGKVLVAKTYITASVWYMCPVFDVPPLIMHQMKCILADWLWAQKLRPNHDWRQPGRITEEMAALPVDKGGINMPNIANKCDALRARFLLQCQQGPDCGWKGFVVYDVLGPRFAGLGRQSLLEPEILKIVGRGQGDAARFISRALQPLVAKFIYANNAQSSRDAALSELLFHNPIPSDTGVSTPIDRYPWAAWVKRGVIRASQLYTCTGVRLTSEQFRTRFFDDISWANDGGFTYRQKLGHEGALAFMHHFLDKASVSERASLAAARSQIRSGEGPDLPLEVGAFYAHLTDVQCDGGPLSTDPPPASLLELREKWRKGEQGVNFWVHSLDANTRLLTRSEETVCIPIQLVLTHHRRVVVADECLVGWWCLGDAILSQYEIQRADVAHADGNVPSVSTLLADLTPKQINAAVFPPYAPASPACVEKWEALARAQRVELPEGVKFTGQGGLLALNHAARLYAPRKRALIMWILLHVVNTGVRVKDFAAEGDKCAGCGNAPETMEHIFWSCPLVREVWTIALRTLDRLSGTVSNKLQHSAAWKTTHFLRVLLTDNPYCAAARPAAPAQWRCLIWSFLRAEALWSIWLHRCAARKIGDRVPVPYTAMDVARTWQCAVRKRVLEERFLPAHPVQLSFENWLTNGAVAILRPDGFLSFHPDIGGGVRLFSEAEFASASASNFYSEVLHADKEGHDLV